MCKVEDCDRESQYIKQDVCQKHYFRMMRYGTYELTQTKKYRRQNPAGYQKLNEPEHPLVNSDGYVYEHRKVCFDIYGEVLPDCPLCGDSINWGNCHIDHIDEDVSNNNPNNLRPLCRPCNTTRGIDYDTFGNNFFIIDGVSKTASGWARMDDVKVAPNTITGRRKRGYSDKDCVYMERKTCQNTKTNKLTLRKMNL